MTENWFMFHWDDGKDEYLKGVSPDDACNKAGYGAGALKAIDYWKQAKEIPMDKKEIILFENDKREYTAEGTMFAKQLREQLESGTSPAVVKIAGHTWTCDIEIEPFAVVARCTHHEKPSFVGANT